MDATIVIATYGDNKWFDIADAYSLKSSRILFKDTPIIRLHGGKTLAQSRNTAASMVETEWICFLDADDELASDYFTVMDQSNADLRIPRLMFWNTNTLDFYEPFKLNRRNMAHSNPCPIGTLIRKDMFDDIGGFWEEPVYEDWSLFRRAWLLGASMQHMNTDYYAYNVGGRNSSTDDPMGEVERIKSSHEEWINSR